MTTEIDWSQGGIAGSVNKWARRDIVTQLATNPVARRARYRPPLRMLRFILSPRAFWRFIAFYVAVNAIMLVCEYAISSLAPEALPIWTSSKPSIGIDIKAIILNTSSYLLSTQVGILAVISLALALVTIISQHESSPSDTKIYYHESLFFELTASCISLLAILCFQLFWPFQFLLHRFGEGTELQFFKLSLLIIHLSWLLVNLAAAAYFVEVTFRFVQQSERETIRERYTVNVLFPFETRNTLRHALYLSAGQGFTNSRGQQFVFFGAEFGEPFEAVVESKFRRPVVLRDIRATWIRWVLRRWHARCQNQITAQDDTALSGRSSEQLVWFTPSLDVPVTGHVIWGKRRRGVPFTWMETFILRRAFVFRRAPDET